MSVSKFLVFLLIFNSNFLAALTGYRPAEHTLAKYIVFLTFKHFKYLGDQQFCAGSMISRNKILTAGHCLVNSKTLQPKDRKHLFVVAGSPFRLHGGVRNAQVMSIRKLILHDDFNYEKAIADVGIIVLYDNIKTNEFVQFLALPNKPPRVGEKCTLLGWGRVYAFGPNPNEVLYTDLFILNRSFCQDAMMPVGMLCAGDPFHNLNDACEGDSGGPLICNETVYGIVSFGAGCGVPYFAGVYTDVWYYKSWIEHNAAAMHLVSISCYLVVFLICVLMKFV